MQLIEYAEILKRHLGLFLTRMYSTRSDNLDMRKVVEVVVKKLFSSVPNRADLAYPYVAEKPTMELEYR